MAKRKTEDIGDILGGDLLTFDEIGTWPAWSTGVPFIDVATGIGGLPRGRIIENYGPESSGKSTIFLKAVSQAQKIGKKCVILDYENSFDPNWAQFLGINVRDKNTFFVAQPRTLEQGFEAMVKLVQKPDVAIVVVDSLAAMAPEASLEVDFNMARLGMLKANLMSSHLQVLNAAMAEHRTQTSICFINQEREEIGFSMTPGKKYTTTGGRALKYYASMRIEFRKVGQDSEEIVDEITLQKEKRVVAHKIRATITKNKVAAPFKRTQFICREGVGIDVVGSVVDLALLRGIISKRNKTWFDIPGEFSHTGQEHGVNGAKNVSKYFRQNTPQYEKLQAHVLEILATAAPADAEYVEEEELEETDDRAAMGLNFISGEDA